mgnify:CR=1 FL=1
MGSASQGKISEADSEIVKVPILKDFPEDGCYGVVFGYEVLNKNQIFNFEPEKGWNNLRWAEHLLACLEKIRDYENRKTFLSLALYWAEVKSKRPSEKFAFINRLLPRWVINRIPIA